MGFNFATVSWTERWSRLQGWGTNLTLGIGPTGEPVQGQPRVCVAAAAGAALPSVAIIRAVNVHVCILRLLGRWRSRLIGRCAIHICNQEHQLPNCNQLSKKGYQGKERLGYPWGGVKGWDSVRVSLSR